MADIQKRLIQLRARRVGDDRPARTLLDAAETRDALIKSLTASNESWEEKRQSKPFTAYAIGAMQPVDAQYTRVSREEAKRVEDQLKPRLSARGIPTEYRLQGSVALDIHIRRVSDVDILALDKSHLTYERHGVAAGRGMYLGLPARMSPTVLANLRRGIVTCLEDAFPRAQVEPGSKAVSIAGGSLRRVVDVVPSHWHDTAEYQQSQLERDRGVTILDASDGRTIENLPFLHIHRIAEQCKATYGGLRKAIRLCKQLKADMEADGRTVALPSFDIAALMYHADETWLRYGIVSELSILGEAQRHLDHLALNRTEARKLKTPDGLRTILDTEKKFEGLTSLSVEMDDLVRQVAREHGVADPTQLTMDGLRTTLRSAKVIA
ncbi:hypothetical protein [Inhella proteolytica]|uniref:cGAS/DncV-like nucleotidyltransferase C-terminal helical domain-containing protein n=1 Tax=Inhella proteolytica TaxID=2795029 RepID=A0A931NEX1_9BURK|nr:hypothetical protein [Inhella proteolytica]MBH9578162.1 hypothetical protein [Inhella proteolytica]